MSSCLGKKYNVTWQQTMLRIYNPKETVEFYEKHFGMVTLHTYHFDDMKFSLYFLITPPYDEEERKKLPPPNTKESEEYLWNLNTVALELTHNHDSDEKLANGNEEGSRGFGHIAFNCKDVIQLSDELVKKSVRFHKLPHEGKMKSIAFALDPNNYWIEIVKRSNDVSWNHLDSVTNFSQTMLRIKDPEKSLQFYINILGMHLVHIKRNEGFTLYFLSSTYINSSNKKESSTMIQTQSEKPFQFSSLQNEESTIYEGNEAYENFKRSWSPVLELTHNHGTEKDISFSYHNGNTNPRGFGHIGFLVDNLESYCKELEVLQIPFKKKMHEGKMNNIAFILDPDGYWVELIQRGTTFMTK